MGECFIRKPLFIKGNAMSTDLTVERWNGRGNLAQLVRELERQKESRLDFVVDTRQVMVGSGQESGTLNLVPKSGTQVTEFLPTDGMLMQDRAIKQLGQRVEPKIPAKFIGELVAHDDAVAADLVNGLLSGKTNDGHRRLIRTLDGRVRAVMSSQYQILDHYDLAFAALEAAQAHGGQVIEASLSESQMRLKFTSQQVWDVLDGAQRGDGQKPGAFGNQEFGNRAGWWSNPNYSHNLPGGGGTVYPLVCIENSETGEGGLRVRIGLLAGICFNSSIVHQAVGVSHIGKAMGVGRYSEETRSADAKAIMLKARDEIISAFNPEVFKALIAKVRNSAEDPIEAPTMAVDQVVSRSELTEESRDKILTYFLKDYQPTRYGLAQAVSRYAQDCEGVEQAAQVEEVAGSLMVSRALIG